MICDAEGTELPAGEEGEVWLRTVRERPTYRYVGATAGLGKADGSRSVTWAGSTRRLSVPGRPARGHDPDRRRERLPGRGRSSHAGTSRRAVGGRSSASPTTTWATSCTRSSRQIRGTVSPEDLLSFVAERVARYKVPRSMEYTDEPLRNEAGKVRRSALRAERTPGAPPKAEPSSSASSRCGEGRRRNRRTPTRACPPSRGGRHCSPWTRRSPACLGRA